MCRRRNTRTPVIKTFCRQQHKILSKAQGVGRDGAICDQSGLQRIQKLELRCGCRWALRVSNGMFGDVANVVNSDVVDFVGSICSVFS